MEKSKAMLKNKADGMRRSKIHLTGISNGNPGENRRLVIVTR